MSGAGAFSGAPGNVGFTDVVSVLRNISQGLSSLNTNLGAIAAAIGGVQIGSFTGTTNGSGQFAVTFAAAFSTAPGVVACSGSAPTGEVVAVVAGSVTTTGFTAQWTTAAATPTVTGQSRTVLYVAGT